MAPSTCCAGRDGHIPVDRTDFRRRRIRGTQDGDDGVAHWRLERANRQAIGAAGFEVLPKRWIVERTFAWISRNRRLARDFERYATTVSAFIRLAMIRIMLRRLAEMPRHESKLLGWALRGRARYESLLAVYKQSLTTFEWYAQGPPKNTLESKKADQKRK